MSINVFNLPDLGEGLTEAEILHWLVAEGDTVALDQPVVEVETAKSAVEVPSPFEGVVHRLHGAEGETMIVGQPLISVADSAADAAGATASGPPSEGAAAGGDAGPASGPSSESGATEQAPPPDRGADYREEERAGTQPTAEESADDAESSGNVLIGYGTSSGGSARRRRRKRSSASAHSLSGRATGAAGQAHDALTAAPRMAPTVISPLVRKLAKEHGVDITVVAGTGPGGLIMRQDVLAAMDLVDDQRRRADSAGPAPSALATPAPTPPAPAGPGPSAGARGAASSAPDAVPAGPRDVDPRTGLTVATREPVKGVRKAIADAMVRSRTEIPEATVWVDVDATALLELRAELKAKDPETAPSLLALIARFTLAGLREYPQLCSRIDSHEDGTRSIARFDGVNLGLAVESERGLVVPNLRNADRLSVLELGKQMREIIAVARSGKASPAQLSGSTFTLNNYGVFGTDGATPIINHPEVGILGIGRIIDRPWVVDGQIVARKVTTLTLAFDHRVCDGGTAGGFLRFVADAVEEPMSAFLRL